MAANVQRPYTDSAILPRSHKPYMLPAMCHKLPCTKMHVSSRHHCPLTVTGPKFAPHETSACPGGLLNISPPIASVIPRNTATLIPKIACVTTIDDDCGRAQGAVSTRWYCTSSPRCTASCCLHHWQIFLPKVNPGICRPHCTHCAIRH